MCQINERPYKNMKLHLYKTILVVLIIFTFLLSGCCTVEPIDCPLTDLGWEITSEELIASEGEALSTYDSIYGGLTYTYESSYMNRTGIIKYMYDGDGILMSVGWTYSSDDADELKALYDEIHEQLVAEYGESGYTTNEETNYGDVWKLKEGHIIISVVLIDTNKALQISYVNPLNEK